MRYHSLSPVQLYHGENTLHFNEMKTMISIVHFTIIRYLNILNSLLDTTYKVCCSSHMYVWTGPYVALPSFFSFFLYIDVAPHPFFLFCLFF